MEADKPFESYEPNLFPRIKRVGQVIARLVHFLPETPLATHGDHFVRDMPQPVEPQE